MHLQLQIHRNVALKNVNYVQIHPTTLYSQKKGRRFLISESVRGEGAVLLDKNGERFTDELQPRDMVSREIHRQMEKDHTKHVWLSLKTNSARCKRTVPEYLPEMPGRGIRYHRKNRSGFVPAQLTLWAASR